MSLLAWAIYLKGLSSRSIIEIYLIKVFDDDDGDGDDEILNSHNFLIHDRYKNRYHFRELNVPVKSFLNVVNHTLIGHILPPGILTAYVLWHSYW